MIRPMENATSLPAWSLQPNQPPPQMGGPPPGPNGTPTSVNQPPLSATPPTSGVVQQSPSANHQQGGPPPPQMASNGNAAAGAATQPTAAQAQAAAAAANMYNSFIPGSIQQQSLPNQFPYHQFLLQPGQTPLLQQPIMTQGQPVTSIASGIQQIPYGVPHSHHGKY